MIVHVKNIAKLKKGGHLKAKQKPITSNDADQGILGQGKINKKHANQLNCRNGREDDLHNNKIAKDVLNKIQKQSPSHSTRSDEEDRVEVEGK